MTVLGYARVSTVHQSVEMQVQALNAAGAERIWTEQMSGGRDDRPELAALLDEQPGSRRVLRHLALFEMALQHHGLEVLRRAPLPLLHAACCAGRLVELLFQQHPVLAELAQEQRRLLRTPMALALDACRRASQPERFYCCRSGREVAALLTRLATLPPTLHKQGASELLLWALGLSPCPVESESGKFSEACARRIVEMFRAERIDPESTDFRLRGAVAAAAWLVEADASELAAPSQSEFEALFFPDAGSHV